VDLRERLAQHRAEEAKLSWEGTFLEYFEQVKQDPRIAELSHARIHRMIRDAGVETDDDGVRRYAFFMQDIFGLEKPLEQLVEYFNSAARRLEVRKRILLLMGPVGGGKSTIVSLLKRGMERFSRSEDGGVYAIKGCPMHEEPLHLVPEPVRAELRQEYGLYIEGDLCPWCRQMLQDRYHGVIENVPVQRIAFSEKHRVGIGTFTPSDPKSQDISELTGSVDLSTIGEYGSESDPRAYRFDGELNIANRGIMEFVEMNVAESNERVAHRFGLRGEAHAGWDEWSGLGNGSAASGSCREIGLRPLCLSPHGGFRCGSAPGAVRPAPVAPVPRRPCHER